MADKDKPIVTTEHPTEVIGSENLGQFLADSYPEVDGLDRPVRTSTNPTPPSPPVNVNDTQYNVEEVE